jgi:hypothetical protein
MDESMAALQIRYWRAVMNKAFNSSKDLEIRPVFTAEQAALWKTDAGAWKKAVESHLRDLGLDPADFMRLIVESFSLHSSIPAKERELQEHEDFLPPRTQGKIENKIEKKKSIFERSAEIVE